LQQYILAAFSPKGLANPGKIIPEKKSSGWLDSTFCKTKLQSYDEGVL
jgi:hypothetical protein